MPEMTGTLGSGGINTQQSVVSHDIASGRPITYFKPDPSNPSGRVVAGVTSSGGTFYSVPGTGEDVFFQTADAARQYAASRGITARQLVGESDIPSSDYWRAKEAEQAYLKAQYGVHDVKQPISEKILTDIQRAQEPRLLPPVLPQREGEIGRVRVGEIVQLPDRRLVGTPEGTLIIPETTKPTITKPLGRTEFGYVPVDLNYLLGTPEALKLTQQYRESMPRFQVQTGKVIETYAYNQGIFLTDVFGGKVEVQPGMRYMRDIFGFTSETPMFTGAPKVTEEQAATIRFSEQVGLIGASSGFGGIFTTTAGLRGATLIQPGELAEIARSFGLASRKMFGRPGLIGETARAIYPITEGTPFTKENVFGTGKYTQQFKEYVSGIVSEEKGASTGTIYEKTIQALKGEEAYIGKRTRLKPAEIKPEEKPPEVPKEPAKDTVAGVFGLDPGRYIKEATGGKGLVYKSPMERLTEMWAQRSIETGIGTKEGQVLVVKQVSKETLKPQGLKPKTKEAPQIVSEIEQLKRPMQTIDATPIKKSISDITQVKPFPQKVKVFTAEDILGYYRSQKPITVQTPKSITQQTEKLAVKQELKQAQKGKQETGLKPSILTIPIMKTVPTAKEIRETKQKQKTEQLAKQLGIQVPILVPVVTPKTTIKQIPETISIQKYYTTPIETIIPTTPQTEIPINIQPPFEVPRYTGGGGRIPEPTIPRIPIFEEDKRRRKGKPIKTREKYFQTFRAVNLIQPLAGIKDMFKMPVKKTYRKSKKGRR